jgi:hypothetical protein
MSGRSFGTRQVLQERSFLESPAQRYELRDIGPTCFAQGLTGFLQFIAELRGAGSVFRCSQCKSDTMVKGGPRWL